jgi:hypothetical protein
MQSVLMYDAKEQTSFGIGKVSLLISHPSQAKVWWGCAGVDCGVAVS